MAHRKSQQNSGVLGLTGVILFVASLVIFGSLNPEFSFRQDFVSKLGAIGEPNAVWWNLIGFGLVGLILAGFGIRYGNILNDKFAGVLLALFGIGFSFTSVPIDLIDSNTQISKVHIVAICLALACWLFGLARISYNSAHKKSVRNRANVAAVVIVISMIGGVLGFWTMPITHRLVFATVFGWTAITSFELRFMSTRNGD